MSLLHQKPVIACDMDDVIYTDGMIRLVNKFTGNSYTIEDIKRLNLYYIQELVPEKYRAEFTRYMFNEGLYKYADISPKAYEVLEEINKYYLLLITSAYKIKEDPRNSNKLLFEKHEVLMRDFPFISMDQYMFGSAKQVINAFGRIDDRYDNLLGPAEIRLLFDAPSNQEISLDQMKQYNIVRAKGFKEVGDILLEEKLLRKIYVK